jgi:hypothetical protein
MRHDCPHCGESLKRRLVRSTPAPGQRKILPLRAIALCPLCKGLIDRNPHWTDKWFALLPVPLYLALQARSFLQSNNLWLPALSLAVACLAAAIVLYWRHLRSWPFYRKYEAGAQPAFPTSPSERRP